MEQKTGEHTRRIGVLQREVENARTTISLLRNLAAVLRRDLNEARLRSGDTEAPVPPVAAVESRDVEAHGAAPETAPETAAEATQGAAASAPEAGATDAVPAGAARPHRKRITVSRRAAEHLQFYYQDYLSIDRRHIDREEAERLYEVLKYLFAVLKKEGVVSKEK